MVRRNEVPNQDIDSNFRYLFNGQLDSGGLATITAGGTAASDGEILGQHIHTVLATGSDYRLTLPQCSDALGKTVTVIVQASAAVGQIDVNDGNTFFTTSGGSPSLLSVGAGSKSIDFRAISTSQWAVTGMVVLSDAYVTGALTFTDAS